jgi:hypothetical protein
MKDQLIKNEIYGKEIYISQKKDVDIWCSPLKKICFTKKALRILNKQEFLSAWYHEERHKKWFLDLVYYFLSLIGYMLGFGFLLYFRQITLLILYFLVITPLIGILDFAWLKEILADRYTCKKGYAISFKNALNKIYRYQKKKSKWKTFFRENITHHPKYIRYKLIDYWFKKFKLK